MSALLRWSHGALRPEPADAVAGEHGDGSSLLVADSWLVLDGAVLRLDEHRRRFLGSARAALGADGDEGELAESLDGFWRAVESALPTDGAWFPRVELDRRDGAPRIRLRLRAAPPRRTETVLGTWTGADPRTTPLVKGPDLDALARLRRAVETAGADEAVILDRGAIAEGAFSALLWWRDDVLHLPPAELPRIPSVTEAAVLELARERGVAVRHEAAAPAELDGAEIWACSALHGIRIATRWIDGPRLVVAPRRRDEWASELAARRDALG